MTWFRRRGGPGGSPAIDELGHRWPGGAVFRTKWRGRLFFLSRAFETPIYCVDLCGDARRLAGQGPATGTTRNADVLTQEW